MPNQRLSAGLIKSIGNHRGAPRVWLQGQAPSRAGFAPGRRYTVAIDEERKFVTLTVNESGDRIVSFKRVGDKEQPIIDLNSAKMLGLFEGMEQIRVVFGVEQIWICPVASENRRVERLNRLNRKLQADEPILVGSLSHGGGILSHAIHTGLNRGGIASKLAFANDIRDECLDLAASNNDSWDQDTIGLAMPMQELAFDDWMMSKLPKVEIIEAGLPCSGASVAGRAKRKLSMPEAHEHVGHLVVAFLAIIAKVNPTVIIFENVTEYADTASMLIMRYQLRDLGYVLHESEFRGGEWNALEDRHRMALVAVTKGMSFDINALVKPEKKELRLGDVMDDVPPDSDRWSTMQYLKDKQDRDRAAGKGFMMQVFNPESNRVSTIGKGYAKIRSTEPKIQSSTDPNLLRQLTPAEHSRVKQIPAHLVRGAGETLAHEVLGQSVNYTPFEALGALLGSNLATGQYLLPMESSVMDDDKQENTPAQDVVQLSLI